MQRRPFLAFVWLAAWPLAGCALTLVAFWSVGRTFFDHWVLDLGSLSVPNPRQTSFFLYWALLGSVAGLLLIVGTTRALDLVSRRRDPSENRSRVGGVFRGAAADERRIDTIWVATASALVFLVAVVIRVWLLRGAPLTDDESAYKFMAELLTAGRLWADSHPLKTFFDRVFMINDGKFYSQYFIGWPLLMAPAVYVGATGYVNALYSALTVPALFAITRRVANSAAARAATLFYVGAPMLAVGAATELSHPSCMMLLAWSFYAFLRAKDGPGDWRPHAAMALLFSLAFLVRPTSALGAGFPMLAAWALTVAKLAPRARNTALLSFAVPAVLLAVVFFGVNRAQNGSVLVTAYARMQEYMRAVNYEHVGWSAKEPPIAMRDYVLGTGGLPTAIARTTVALVRLAFDLFGSPMAVVLVLLAWAVPSLRILWWSALSYILVHFYLADSGIDSFGPVHYYEMALPVLVLAGAGTSRLAHLSTTWRPSVARAWPVVVPAALVAVSLAGFVPVRMAALRRIASNVNAPAEAVRKARLSNVIVFTAGAFVPQACIAPTRHFVWFRPNNDPGLRNDILWANHLGWEEDKQLLPHFPGRTGYLLMWKGCRPELMRIQ
jgi:hypothetical protein